MQDVGKETETDFATFRAMTSEVTLVPAIEESGWLRIPRSSRTETSLVEGIREVVKSGVYLYDSDGGSSVYKGCVR
ncbi:hypothetical protein GN958_ATG03197 [Phytophthora infestans]|uniref:Uncharacterized protein n=1 Tax=Phytophthora infestans TaxID=4787 RepID=A0A8S9V8B7_PHYIN|nr:hypothetical protein GN958_ATG03197 [Phytophthora infestans]